MTIKELKKGEYFTIKPISEPKESQVWVKGEYDRTTKTYQCTRFDDICACRCFKSSKTIYTDFIF